MPSYPVHYAVEKPPRLRRIQLLVRAVAFIALGVVGLSFGTVFLFAYLLLPAIAATRSTNGSQPSYFDSTGQHVLRALRWFAAVSAWAALLTDRLPANSPDELVRVTVDRPPAPVQSGAIWRVVTGLPSAFALALLGLIGVVVWWWAALSVLLFERVGDATRGYLVGLQRWSVRLLAYQASLVDEYPPFSFADDDLGFGAEQVDVRNNADQLVVRPHDWHSR